jgi:hypothetical protein
VFCNKNNKIEKLFATFIVETTSIATKQTTLSFVSSLFSTFSKIYRNKNILGNFRNCKTNKNPSKLMGFLDLLVLFHSWPFLESCAKIPAAKSRLNWFQMHNPLLGQLHE